MLKVVLVCISITLASAGVLAAADDSNSASTAGLGGVAAQAATPDSCPSPDKMWMTSTRFLPSVAECLHGPESETPDAKRVALVQDIQLKAGAYSILNKITFWVAVALALGMLIWPSFIALRATGAGAKAKDDDSEAPVKVHWTQRATATSAIQTTIAALAALSFAFYAHYKGNQVKAENLMREIIFAEDLTQERITEILGAIVEMDKGFGFTSVEALKAK